MTAPIDITALTPEALRQLNREAASIEESHRRLFGFIQHLRGHGENTPRASSALSRSPAGKSLLRKAAEPVAKELEKRWAKARKGAPGQHNAAVRHLLDVDPEDAAVTTLRILLDGMDRERDLVATARSVGHCIFAEKELLAWAVDNAPIVKHYLSRLATNDEQHCFNTIRALMSRRGLPIQVPPADVLCLVGAYLIETVAHLTGFFESYIEPDPDGKKRPRRLRPTPALRDWVVKHHEARAEALPVYTPLVIPPKDWASGENGGYHFALANRLAFVAGGSRDESAALRDMADPLVLNALNSLQRTKWRINKEVLAVFREVVTNGGNVGGIGPLRELDMPWKPPAVDRGDPEALELWKRRCRDTHRENYRIRKIAVRVTRTLALAEELENEKEFYFALQPDFRGRFYYISPALQPQGPDWMRALLEFATPTQAPLCDRTGAVLGERQADYRALCSHGAARMGTCPWTGEKLSRASYDRRVAWVEEHRDDICGVAECGLRLWTAADDPWQFLAFGFALRDAHRGGLLRLPLQVDGSANAFQHFAAASRDAELGQACNVSPGLRDQEPSDLYGRVASKLGRAKDAVRVRDDRGQLVPAVRLLDRTAVKKACVPIPFGGSLIAVASSLRQNGDLLKRIHPDENFFPISTALARELLTAVSRLFPGIKASASFINAMVSATNRTGADMLWRSPSGFPVSQRYRRYKQERIMVTIHGRLRRAIYVGTGAGERDAKAAKAGAIANVMQSLDAAHMHLVCARLGEGLGYIHDCVLYPADRHEEVYRVLREEFVRVHEEPFFERLYREVRALVGEDVKLPPPPKPGELDLKEVLRSEYLFH